MPPLLMLKGTLHACGPDPAGLEWDWDKAHQRPVADVDEQRGQQMVDRDPQLFAWRDSKPAPRKRATREA